MLNGIASDGLSQVWVEQGGVAIPVGPRMLRQACELCVEALSRQIALGRERVWSNPHIVEVPKVTFGRNGGDFGPGVEFVGGSRVN